MQPTIPGGRPPPGNGCSTACSRSLPFGGTVALEAHGLGSSGSVAHTLDPVGVVIAAGTSLPLIAWRRAPVAVFLIATTASAILMIRGYPAGPPIGPTIALYLLAASRDATRP